MDLNAPQQVDAPWYSLNIDMIPSKAAYFFEYAKEGSHWPYLVLFYVNIGLNPAKAGLITGIRFIGGIVGSAFWGWIADKKQSYKLISIVLCVCAIITTCAQPFITLIMGDPEKNKCKIYTNETSMVDRNDNYNEGTLFYSLISFSVLASFFDGSTMGFADSGVLRSCFNSPRKTNIGRQRYFGPFGFAMGAFFSGLIVDYFPHWHISCYSGIFIVYFICCVGLSLSFHFLFKNEFEVSRLPAGCNVNGIILSKLKSLDTWFFLTTVLFNGVALALAFSYSFLYLKEMNAPSVLLGSGMYINGLAAGLFFVLSKRIVTFVGGSLNGMSVSCAFWGVRYLWLSYMRNPYEYLAICTLNGLTSSLFVYSYVDYIKRNYPPVIFSVVCGISAALYNSGGYLIANVIGGILYQELGPRALMFAWGIACLIWSSLTFIYGFLLACRNKPNKIGVAYTVDRESDINLEEIDFKLFALR